MYRKTFLTPKYACTNWCVNSVLFQFNRKNFTKLKNVINFIHFRPINHFALKVIYSSGDFTGRMKVAMIVSFHFFKTLVDKRDLALNTWSESTECNNKFASGISRPHDPRITVVKMADTNKRCFSGAIF